MTSAQWIKVWICGISGGLLMLNLTNFIVDPFDVFNANVFRKSFETNQRYNKIEYLNSYHNNFDSYILGNSKIGGTNPILLKKYLNANAYNFNITDGYIREYHEILKYMISKKFKINYLYLQIDANGMRNHIRPRDDYQRIMHPLVSRETDFDFFNKYKFYLKYLTIFPFHHIRGKIINNFYGEEDYTFNLKDGTFLHSKREKLIQKDIDEYYKNENGFRFVSHRGRASELNKYYSDILLSYKKIVELCKENNIELIAFFAPDHHIMMDSFVIEDYLAFLSDLVQFGEIYYFGGYNSVTLNDRNYYEITHYRPVVSELIAARIFNDTELKLPADFGIKLNKHNVDNYLIEIEDSIKKHDYEKKI